MRKLTGGLYNKWGYFTVPKKISGYIISEERWVACWLDRDYNLIISKDPESNDMNGIFLWKRFYYAGSSSIQFRIPKDVFEAWVVQFPNQSFNYVKIIVLKNNNLQITLSH